MLEIAKTKQQLENVISKGLDSFYAVGSALVEIKARKLYLGEYNSFEEYCKEKWQISRGYGYYLINASNVVDSIGELPEKASHVKPLYAIKNEELRKQAWQEIKDTGVKVTGEIVTNFAQKYKLFEEKHWLAEYVKLGKVTSQNAVELKNYLRNLPDYYETGLKTHGLVLKAVVQALRTLEYEFDDEAKDILRSGYLSIVNSVGEVKNIPFEKLNSTDIESYQRKLGWEAKQARILAGTQKQNNLVNKTGMLVCNGSEIFEKIGTERTVFYAFPDNMYELKHLQNIMEQNDTELMYVAMYNKDANINWDGISKPASSVNGIKPNLFMNFFKASIP